MKNIDKLLTTLMGFTSTINRYPITILMFLFAAIITSLNISTRDFNNYPELLLSFILGAAAFMVLQMVFEHFYQRRMIRWIFCGLAVLGAILYYVLVTAVIDDFNTEDMIKTMVFLFILFIAFIWVPSIKAEIGWNKSFMAVFKGFFTVMLYSGILFLGIALILMAIDTLIVNVDSDAYSHVGNVIIFIYAPIHFLSLIPIYPAYSRNLESEKPVNQDDLKKDLEPSKFLEGLVSYIIIPLTVIFTVILLIYILMNITGDFWKDNQMEPLLVTYSIIVIIVYLLASVLNSKIALYFRLIFPKVLIPVVLFQTISSILKLAEVGVTSGRYYVILFGIFATISAIIFSIRPNHKNNVVALILMILSLISIIPPVDAFSVSKRNQINRLTNILIKNDMLKNDKLVPGEDISEKDQDIITDSVNYLTSMKYAKDISWLRSYSESYDFYNTFGFQNHGYYPSRETRYYNLYLPINTVIDVSGYDLLVEATFYDENEGSIPITSQWGEKGYRLIYKNTDKMGDLILQDGQGEELIRYSLDNIYERFMKRKEIQGELSLNEASFIIENDKSILHIITKDISFSIWEDSQEPDELAFMKNNKLYIMIKIK